MTLKILPYKIGSLSAKRLARALRVLRVSHYYNAKRSDTIVNWGNSHPPHFRWMDHDLNNPHAIALACNKLETFRKFRDHSFKHVPDWTTNPEEAQHWLNLGLKTYCRKLLSGHSGKGIIVCNDGDTLVSAPLYTLHTKHRDEYRVHVFQGEAIDIQQKRKSFSRDTISNGIRNHASGWVYARDNCNPPSELVTASIEAVKLLGLDFGAVDIGHRIRDNKFFVFEINTAPGLEGSTLIAYANAINNHYRSL